jgi:hypothetical protein
LIDRDRAFGAATLALSAGYYGIAGRIPDSQLADAIGPDGLPKIYAVLLAALSLILIVRSRTTVRLKPDATKDPVRLKPDTTERARHRSYVVSAFRRTRGLSSFSSSARWLAMLAIGVAYIVLVPWLGYVLALAGLIFATTYCQGGGGDRPVMGLAIVALCGAIFCWVLFVLVMGIPQPPGLWTSLP